MFLRAPSPRSDLARNKKRVPKRSPGKGRTKDSDALFSDLIMALGLLDTQELVYTTL